MGLCQAQQQQQHASKAPAGPRQPPPPPPPAANGAAHMQGLFSSGMPLLSMFCDCSVFLQLSPVYLLGVYTLVVPGNTS